MLVGVKKLDTQCQKKGSSKIKVFLEKLSQTSKSCTFSNILMHLQSCAIWLHLGFCSTSQVSGLIMYLLHSFLVYLVLIQTTKSVRISGKVYAVQVPQSVTLSLRYRRMLAITLLPWIIVFSGHHQHHQRKTYQIEILNSMIDKHVVTALSILETSIEEGRREREDTYCL